MAAVEVENLRKEFRRSDGSAPACAAAASASRR